MIKNLLQKNKGYALMFTVVVVSIISLIAIGLSNSTYKQMVLASIATNSQTAFYMADTVVECIEYQDNVVGKFPSNASGYVANNFTCGKDSAGADFTLTITRSSVAVISPVTDVYDITNSLSTSTNPCFSGTVTKSTGTDANLDTVVNTQILGSGYNICNKTNSRTVERTIKVNY